MHQHIEVLRRIYGDRRWILATDVLATSTAQVTDLRTVGVDDVFVVAGSRGTGSVPTDVGSVVLGLSATDLMEAIRAFDDALGDLPATVGAAIDDFDPQRRAAVIAPAFTQRSTAAGRRVWGARWDTWRALEDKTVVDEIWRAAGVPQVPSVLVPATDDAALRDAAVAVDAGRGTVWVADNRRGWHGGATGLRWIRTDAQAADAAAFMAERADRVRVMPFLDGIPCSIHGMVLPDGTVAFRPCEMVVLRRPGRSDLCYAGMASTWDPPAADREAMVGHARRVGEHLRRAVGYRGAFGIDGVMTADGFRPTELNPRFAAALHLLAAAADVPLELVHLAVAEGVDADWCGPELARMVVAAADDSRAVRCHVVTGMALGEREIGLRHADGRLVQAGALPADVTLVCGASPAGGFLRVVPAPDAVPPGTSVAALAARALTWADAHLGLGLGPLEPAPDVRGAA